MKRGVLTVFNFENSYFSPKTTEKQANLGVKSYIIAKKRLFSVSYCSAKATYSNRCNSSYWFMIDYRARYLSKLSRKSRWIAWQIKLDCMAIIQ